MRWRPGEARRASKPDDVLADDAAGHSRRLHPGVGQVTGANIPYVTPNSTCSLCGQMGGDVDASLLCAACRRTTAAARALHRFNAPRVGNDIEDWDTIGASYRARWVKQARLALEAAERQERSEAVTPVVEARG